MHLHAPGTKQNDQYRTTNDDALNKYCQILEETNVAVFGITDYFSADGYFSVADRFRRRYPQSEKVLFCNIEMRLSEIVNRAHEEVNTHIIFNTSLPNHKSNIKLFLQTLRTNKTGEGGRYLFAAELCETHQFESATTTRDYIREALEHTFGRDADLIEFVLIVTAANNDGIRPQSGKQRKLLISDEIDKYSNALFGNSGNVGYYLDTSRGEDPNEFFDPKPVLSGCDAHSFADLDDRLGQVAFRSGKTIFEPTWIKSDPTYEGLKQILFEPKNRVYIGEEPEIERRVRNNRTKYIDSLHLSSIEGYKGEHGKWFDQENIPIGKELVAIIGNKGSGKSALTDSLGLLGNSHHQSPDDKSEDLFSFLNKRKFLKRGCAANFVGTLTWHDGSSYRNTLEKSVEKSLSERVEYLPQKYLERICTTIGVEHFTRTMNKVVFRYVEREHRFGHRRLEDLIDYLTLQAEEEIRRIKLDLHDVNKKIVKVEKKLVADYQRKIEERLRQKNLELTAHRTVRPEEINRPADESLSSEEAAKIQKLAKDINKYEKLIQSLKCEQPEVGKIAEELRQFKQSIERESATLMRMKGQYRELLESADISFHDVVKIQIDLNPVDRVITEKETRLNEIKTLLSDEYLPANGLQDWKEMSGEIDLIDSESIVWKKAVLEHQRRTIVEKQAKPMRKYQAFVSKLKNWKHREQVILGDLKNPDEDSVRGLERELRKIKEAYHKERQTLKSLRVHICTKLFQKKRDIMVIHDRIKQAIDAEIEKCRGDLGDYKISIEAGLEFDESFYRTFLDFINQNRKGSFYGIQEGGSVLRGLCDSVDDWQNENQVVDVLNSIVEALHNDKREGQHQSQDAARDVFKQIRTQQYSVVELYDYLFGLDYLKPRYKLKVDQKELSELSPGERGGLLLVFYLMLDKQDIPLIIDQPEDNLDNKSVYETLVKFIEHAKKRRQIVLVTHNPNLAVVADAEQIIHVSIDKESAVNEFRSFSGSIESPKINRAVVDILEGTMPAFDNRRLKYRRNP